MKRLLHPAILSVTVCLIGTFICSVRGLRVCSKFEACSIVEYGFPPPVSTTTPEPEPEGSGEGSGEGALQEIQQTLIYDELVYGNAVFPPDPDNYTSAESTNFCSCADSLCPDENSTTEENSVRLDAFLRLTFCGAVKSLFPYPCKGRRAVTRVFGELGVSDPDPMLTTTMEKYTKTRFFCHCPSGGYEKLPKIETWNPHAGIYAYVYQCQN